MKRYVGLILIGINVLLVLLLAWMWLTPAGQLKNAHWDEPRGQKTNLDGLIPVLGKPQPMEQSQFLGMLDRPLFSLSRRPPPPPPPPPAAVPPPPPDYLADAVLTGIYTSTDGSAGIIIKFQGKDKSLPLQGVLEGWTLKSVAENRVYFSRGAETKEIQLQKAKLQVGYEPAGNPLPNAADASSQRPTLQDAPKPRRGATLGGSRTVPR